MTRSRLAWGIAAHGHLGDPGGGPGFDRISALDGLVIFGFGIGSFAAVGALLITRVPGEPDRRPPACRGDGAAAALVLGTYADAGRPAGAAVAWIERGPARRGDAVLLPFFIALIGVPLVFPDGRLPSRRFRWVVAITIADIVAWTLGGILRAALDGGSAVATPGTRFTRTPASAPSKRSSSLRRSSASALARSPSGCGSDEVTGCSASRSSGSWRSSASGPSSFQFRSAHSGERRAGPGPGQPDPPDALRAPDRDRHRHPPVPAVRDRSDHQHGRSAWAVVTGVLVGVFAGLVVALQAALAERHAGADAGRGRVHARCGRALSASATAGPVGRGPALRPPEVRRAAHRRCVCRTPPQRGRPAKASDRARCDRR